MGGCNEKSKIRKELLQRTVLNVWICVHGCRVASSHLVTFVARYLDVLLRAAILGFFWRTTFREFEGSLDFYLDRSFPFLEIFLHFITSLYSSDKLWRKMHFSFLLEKFDINASSSFCWEILSL